MFGECTAGKIIKNMCIVAKLVEMRATYVCSHEGDDTRYRLMQKSQQKNKHDGQ